MLYYYALQLFLFLTLSLRIISIRVQNEKKFFPKNYTFNTTFDISDTRNCILIPLLQGIIRDTILKNLKDTIKVACVGDSVTYGYGISNWPKNNNPFILESFLGDEYTVNNYGFCGSCVQSDGNKPYSSKSPYKKSLEFEPDIVIFMLAKMTPSLLRGGGRISSET